ncbi:hypothetical protein M2459_002368 [Parabacteroides sp. PF5-5]|uniref:PepSY-like domain-containing protein n=1 Tax=unclassified Parabacteroides TaxID=2649774 RepID=UPI00247539E9|nr:MULTISPECIES: PepSY-like domain-containing protein [unclassified Parabacteroides]MDH6305268.1 hypothetical protein [Parabacteroides sp. PH5-39]MDH6316621.1 hypothetical protein [Parabacteroides sp. PF5-13]MDH6320199.1 hypothetical protein [Parabacteroides sp. PH5-13]MDH6323858.1 hypothetical protein [Parabacteroides sp. PH5-8]MDH6327876.1 hypothetical protein [Parabacteroides sp. PH5-41]
MRTKKNLLFFTLPCFVLLLFSCTIDSDNKSTNEPEITSRITPNEEVLRAFDTKYPYAKDIVWSNNETYYVADFTELSKTINAWFEPSGEWVLSKVSVTAEELHKEVSIALKEDSFTEYEIESRSLLKRKDFEDIYVLEAEKNNRSYNLYFSTGGDFIKTIAHDYNFVDSPVSIPAAITDFVTSSFNNPAFLDLWYDSLGMKVGISESGTYKIVAFDSTSLWICTIWNVEETNVPIVVMDSFKNSKYGSKNVQSTKIKENNEEVAYLFYFSNEGKQSIATLTETGRFKSILSY